MPDEDLSVQAGNSGGIDAHTALYAVLGNPVAHSLSPVMHNAAFARTGYNGVYVALTVTDPGAAVTGLRALGIAGASVTIPIKTDVVGHLDQVDPMAAAIGAVNTIVNRGGRLTGYNTDGSGAVHALADAVSIKDRRVAVIGAGGAAHAISYALVEKGAQVVIVNRSAARGESLARRVQADFVPIEDFNGDRCNVLINTTPLGMIPDIEAMPVDEKVLRPDMVVMDVVYHPLTTRLLREAGRIGCRTVNGVEMFVRQGAAQFELWTGLPAPVGMMRSVVVNALQNGKKQP
jgi:shikimate dehydrogenase